MLAVTDRSIDLIMVNLKYNDDKMKLVISLKGVPALNRFKLSVACARLLHTLRPSRLGKKCGCGRGRWLEVYAALCRHMASNEYTIWHS